jgi:transcriptional regulator with XRE-family HTH domain
VRFASRKEVKQTDLHAIPDRKSILRSKRHWQDKELREAYAEAAVEQGIAWQIRLNREMRNLSQKQLAELLGTKQSAISRLEDPDYGSHSIETLLSLSKIFDCALLVKLISYSDLAVDSTKLSEQEQFAVPFSEEADAFHG